MIEFVDFQDGAVLDLVVHFLGIATHDNMNSAPSCVARLAYQGDVNLSQPAFVAQFDTQGALALRRPMRRPRGEPQSPARRMRRCEINP